MLLLLPPLKKGANARAAGIGGFALGGTKSKSPSTPLCKGERQAQRHNFRHGVDLAIATAPFEKGGECPRSGHGGFASALPEKQIPLDPPFAKGENKRSAATFVTALTSRLPLPPLKKGANARAAGMGNLLLAARRTNPPPFCKGGRQAAFRGFQPAALNPR